MREIDVIDFNNKLVNQIYKEIDKMVEKVDKEDIDELLRKENELSQ